MSEKAAFMILFAFFSLFLSRPTAVGRQVVCSTPGKSVSLFARSAENVRRAAEQRDEISYQE
jgi:hypothetical protein